MRRWLFPAMMVLALTVAAPLAASSFEAPKRPTPAETEYDPSQPGAEDPRVQEGFAAYQAHEFERAFDIWLPLADAGNAEAQFWIGRLYDFGEGVRMDQEGAFGWYELAAEQGHVFANYNLGNDYLRIGRSKEDYQKAVTYLSRAAETGDRSAQYNLAIAYFRWSGYLIDDGHDASFVKSFKWFYITHERGHPRALQTIERASALPFISPSDIEAGKAAMREWFQKHPRTAD